MARRPLGTQMSPWLDAIQIVVAHIGTLMMHWDSRGLVRASATFVRLVRDAAAAARSMRSARRNSGRNYRSLPLEGLERDFMKARDAIYETRRRAHAATRRARKGGPNERKIARNLEIARRDLERLVRDTASALKAEMERRGAWNDVWAKSIGITDWV